MKKSLLLINIICVFSLILACKNSQKPNSPEVSKDSLSKVVIKDSVKTPPPVPSQTTSSGSIPASKGVKKDTANTNNKPRAIIHHSSDDAKLDSIKNAKNKMKK